MIARLLGTALVIAAAASVSWTVSADAQAKTAALGQPNIAELWERPDDLASRDLFNGPWGSERAPDPNATYEFVAPKKGGINPGMTVRDPRGREWRVKQPPTTGRGAEGPIEVVLSRVLSAVGYHQPPVYFLPTFTLSQKGSTRQAPGGRFRLNYAPLRDRGDWSWTENPFVGTKPYQGLLVILLMFNSSDLKNSNNTLYEFTPPSGDRVERWYVVRDLGTALGSTARLTPIRGNPEVFERLGFIKRIENRFVEFEYDGRHQGLVNGRITPDDVCWASELLSGLTLTQWHDAFRAGGYQPDISDRFITRLRAKIGEGLALRALTERF
jgi:hypothetical protein